MTEKYLSVKALTQYLKRKFDADPHLQRVFVVGEVSNFRLRPNAHQYFNLKDEQARISAVMYKGAFNKLNFRLEEGMKVLAVGRVTLFEPSGQYQLVIESIQPDGVGALYQALEQLKQKFQAAGLFQQNQRPIVRFPKKIAVITSPTGAVIRDILTTIKRRYPIVQVTVFPTRVQGKESVAEIVKAFEQVKQRATEFDTVILARGGGSIEDLWFFNEEVVAQAILSCPIPVISSIGHETDITIADLVADLRAPTPTAAAELSTPVMVELLQGIAAHQERLIHAMNKLMREKQKRLTTVQQSYVLMQPERLYQAYSQQLDALTQLLNEYQQRYFSQKNHEVQLLTQRLLLSTPQQKVKQHEQQVNFLTERLSRSMQHYLQEKQQVFQKQIIQLDAYSPLNILARGYSVVTAKNEVVKSIEQVDTNQMLSIRVSDGLIQATVEATQPEQT
ncbi:exodeoxyribonuclease VII large subunit [Tuanshanicoccus lijuaniae]|uniref:exodeoxyribonuclease VII large subunit n=1 Tax=Aerococcaceae bacterium zg-1292 TaxID=2774330 RepID=UPI001BD8DC8F|nr:exodeoxyribonuclease VII large subunit [Aerococcaceae bacterium zg-A91]MBS4457931.1 exodeoxyribonuclease VII large subunit [Aerococcaceae bacterium zg-BR33]